MIGTSSRDALSNLANFCNVPLRTELNALFWYVSVICLAQYWHYLNMLDLLHRNVVHLFPFWRKSCFMGWSIKIILTDINIIQNINISTTVNNCDWEEVQHWPSWENLAGWWCLFGFGRVIASWYLSHLLCIFREKNNQQEKAAIETALTVSITALSSLI